MVTQARVLHSEWAKLWSLRSTRWSIAVAFIAMALIGVIVSAVNMSRWHTMTPHDRLTYDALDLSLSGIDFAQLAIGVLGVLVITGEYSTGMIRSSFMAVPRRLPVLWAKIGVFSAVTFVLMLIGAVIAFFISAPIVHAHVPLSISQPHAVRAIVGVALVMAVLAVFCVSLGALIRNTAGGIATFAGVFFALPGIVEILGTSIKNSISPYLPSSAAATLYTARPDAGSHALSPWGGFVLFCGYTLVMLVVAAYLIRKRDA
jgi:ABC-type transport system involved in multi-copper enzyme maturation permease subunit